MAKCENPLYITTQLDSVTYETVAAYECIEGYMFPDHSTKTTEGKCKMDATNNLVLMSWSLRCQRKSEHFYFYGTGRASFMNAIRTIYMIPCVRDLRGHIALLNNRLRFICLLVVINEIIEILLNFYSS